MTEQNTDTDRYLKCREAEKTHVCAQCGANLTTIFDTPANHYVVRCGKDPGHKGGKRKLTDIEVISHGEASVVVGQGVQENIEKYWQEIPSANPLLPKVDTATGGVISGEQMQGLVRFAESVSLKAYLGHVCLYFGKPYITIDGYYYLKNVMHLGFVAATMPMTPEERISYMVTEGSHAYLARALTKGGDELARGIGIVTAEEMNEPSRKTPSNFAAPVVHNKPQIMAEKRAEWQLMQKMIPLGIRPPTPQSEVHQSLPDEKQAEMDIKDFWE
jgi:hypothetical protein